MNKNKEIIEKLTKELAEKHNQILDDFTKAYLAERFEGKPFKPSEVKLIQQYKDDHIQWFFEPLTTEDGQSVEQIREYAYERGRRESILNIN